MTNAATRVVERNTINSGTGIGRQQKKKELYVDEINEINRVTGIKNVCVLCCH